MTWISDTGACTLRTSSTAESFGLRKRCQSKRGVFSAWPRVMWRCIVKGLIRGWIIEKSATGEISSSDATGRAWRAVAEIAFAAPYENATNVTDSVRGQRRSTSFATAARSSCSWRLKP